MIKGNDGQIIAPLILLLIPAVILLGFFFSSSRAVLDRIRLQTEADCAVTSAASWVACGMNEIADANLITEVLTAMLDDANNGSLPANVREGRIALVKAELRRIERIKSDIIEHITIEAKKSVAKSAKGAIAINSAGELLLPLNENMLDTTLCSIVAIKAKKNTFALGAKIVLSEANVDGSLPIVPDFKPEWCKNELSGTQYDFFNTSYPAALEHWSRERINSEILH
jgi:hypothetical protein